MPLALGKCFDPEERTISALTLRETYVWMQQGSTAQLQPLNELDTESIKHEKKQCELTTETTTVLRGFVRTISQHLFLLPSMRLTDWRY